jgi:hypothetical protein
MRTAAVLVLVTACAQNTGDDVDYTRIAEEVGGTIATPDAGGEAGALADAMSIARGEVPHGFTTTNRTVIGYHDGLRYEYAAICDDASGARMACSPVSFHAAVSVVWQGRSATWTFEHLQGDLASAVGAGALGNEAFLLDHESARPRHGHIALSREDIHGTVEFDGSRKARINLDDQMFAVDLATGAITTVIDGYP